MLKNITGRHILLISLAVLIAYFISIWRVANVPVYGSKQGRSSIRGDQYSDTLVHQAGMYFYDFGFRKSSFLPMHGYKGDQNDLNIHAYTHYLPLPDILCGVYMKILRTKDDQTIRVFPLLISLLWLFLIFKTLLLITKNINHTILGFSILILSNYFIAWADNFHKHMFEELSKWWFLYCTWMFMVEKNKKYIIWAVLAMALAISVSFEAALVNMVLFTMLTILFQRKIFTKEIIMIGTMAVFIFLIHLWQNTLYFDSFEIAIDDLLHSYQQRAVGHGPNVNELGHPIGFLDYLTSPIKSINRIERFFLISGWAAMILFIFYLKKEKTNNYIKLLISLFIASVSWSLIFPQHSSVHAFTSRNWGLFMGIITAVILPYYFTFLKATWSKSTLYKTIHCIFIGYILVMAVSQQIWELYLKYGLLYPKFGL